MSIQATLPPIPKQAGRTFKPIPGFHRYLACDDGSIWTCNTVGYNHTPVAWRKRRLRKHPSGHLRIYIKQNGKSYHCYVHRLILLAFVGPAPAGTECCHYNGIHADNRPSNLRWGTRLDNVHDAIRHGRHGRKKARP